MGRPNLFTLLILLTVCAKVQAQQGLYKKGADSLPATKNLLVLPQNFYSQHLTFFCTKELQLQKLTGKQVYFRLGSKDYVDYLEQKPNARKGF